MGEINLNDAIVKRLKRGEQSVIRQLYRLAYPECASFIKNNNGTGNDAEDFFQEALVVLYKNVHKPDFELKSHIKTYLYAINRNLWLTELRKRSKNGLQLVMDDKDTDYVLYQEDTLVEKQEVEKKHKLIGEMLQQVKGGCKDILIDFYYKKLSLKAIAEKYGFTAQYAKKRRYKCMEAFKKQVRAKYATFEE
ncbi:MAG: sigma-70 family RNA polymerase sigma factor [Bacteroidota bacterium]